MKIAESRPYGEPFTSSIASSSLRIVETGTTGPNVSSRAISMSSVTPSSTVASKNRSLPCCGARLPPATTVAPRSSASRHVTLGLGRGRLVVDRPHRRRVVERVAEADPLVDRRGEPREVLVLHVLVDEDPLARRAALPGVQEARDERRLDGRVEVAVLQDHERPVAAHLEQQLLAGGPLRHRVAGRDRADEPDGLRPGVRGDLVADDRARARSPG